MLNKTLLGSAAVIMTMVGAQAADLPSKKAAPATYVKICDAYGAGFFYIPGTDTCVKVGGYVRVDYDYRPERKNTVTTGGTVPVTAVVASATKLQVDAVARVEPTGFGNSANLAAATTADTNTSGFYNRGTIQLDARTPTSMGVARTFMALRLETGSGVQAKSATQPSLEGAFVQWAGFTAGQAAQPFAFMSSWAYNTAYWTGWPSGVRQLTYTAVLGGGFSVTAGITDSKNYNVVSSAAKDASNLGSAVVEGAGTPGYNSIIYVGNVRYDQSWGSVQVMAAGTQGGNLMSANGANSSAADVALLLNTANTSATASHESGYAFGGGVAVNLPMLAAGDRLEATVVYAQRIANLLADAGINSPSAAAYGSNPIGGPAVSFANGSGWSYGAQLRHYFTAQVRTQLYASYTTREQNFLTGGVKGSGNAYTLGGALIYSPAKDFDIGLELQYIRASWDQAAVRSAQPIAASLLTTNMWGAQSGMSANNLVSKVRVQRNF